MPPPPLWMRAAAVALLVVLLAPAFLPAGNDPLVGSPRETGMSAAGSRVDLEKHLLSEAPPLCCLVAADLRPAVVLPVPRQVRLVLSEAEPLVSKVVLSHPLPPPRRT